MVPSLVPTSLQGPAAPTKPAGGAPRGVAPVPRSALTCVRIGVRAASAVTLAPPRPTRTPLGAARARGTAFPAATATVRKAPVGPVALGTPRGPAVIPLTAAALLVLTIPPARPVALAQAVPTVPRLAVAIAVRVVHYVTAAHSGSKDAGPGDRRSPTVIRRS